MSTLSYVLLAHLARRPATGYDLARALERPLGYFWTARHSQIYPELAKLEAVGHVEATDIPGGPGPRTKREYRLTDAGREHLVEWLLKPGAPAPVRDEQGLRMYALWLLDRDDARAVIAAERAHRVERKAVFVAELERLGTPKPDEPTFGGYIASESGVRFAQMRIEWCDWVLSLLD